MIAATASKALHVLESDVTVRRRHTADGGDPDLVFAPTLVRIPDLKSRRLYSSDKPTAYP